MILNIKYDSLVAKDRRSSNSLFLSNHEQFRCALPIFCNHFIFAMALINYVLFVVKLIINNAPLTYVYPNTIKTCLTPNHLLLDRQLLYSSNTASNVVTKPFYQALLTK